MGGCGSVADGDSSIAPADRPQLVYGCCCGCGAGLNTTYCIHNTRNILYLSCCSWVWAAKREGGREGGREGERERESPGLSLNTFFGQLRGCWSSHPKDSDTPIGPGLEPADSDGKEGAVARLLWHLHPSLGVTNRSGPWLCCPQQRVACLPFGCRHAVQASCRQACNP